MVQDAGDSITSVTDIDPSSSPTELLTAAERNKISTDKLESSEKTLEMWARQAWLYIRARDAITCAALRNILEKTPASSRRCLINDRFNYSWSAGTFLAHASALPVQEMWFPPGSPPKVAQEIKTYLAIRGRYYVDALFDFINYANRLGALSPSGVLTADLSQQWLKLAGTLEGALHLSKMDILPVIDPARSDPARSDPARSFVAPLVTSQSLRSLIEALGLRFTTNLGELAQLLEYLGTRAE